MIYRFSEFYCSFYFIGIILVGLCLPGFHPADDVELISWRALEAEGLPQRGVTAAAHRRVSMVNLDKAYMSVLQKL